MQPLLITVLIKFFILCDVSWLLWQLIDGILLKDLIRYLLTFILFPITMGLYIYETTTSYDNDTIFLFMGGFMVALEMERWNLHKRIALNIISAIGTNINRIILGFMVATGFLSMWISNT